MQGAGGVGGMLSESSPITSNPITFNSSYPTYDGNGNVSEYLDSTGQITAHFEYDPFGNAVVNTDTSNQFAYRFSTKPLAFATGLYYYGYRYYDPLTGRWPSRDPIEEDDGPNLYAYVSNNTNTWFDILGQQASLPGGREAAANAAAQATRLSKQVADMVAKINKMAKKRGSNKKPCPEEEKLTKDYLDKVHQQRKAAREAKELAEKYKKTNGDRSPYRPGRNDRSNTRKDAYEKAKRAGEEMEPKHHPNENGRSPHYQPNVPNGHPLAHDHYIYPG
jgi:RHS repeat-associated protein